ncbi:hypothetical protein [Leclercia tamurae]|uniref:Uncharacterized protein n=1 Tax=Leclercia tamurae TaxID=2926467 RepID=A0ABT2RCQ1_9ENTR|nr:hypothetical protein [Leclercia tamurae]MCU6678667.1 hypothetical protein [Leclercia tamurae]
MSIHTMEIEINNLINQICNGVTGGELKQLGALFTPTFLDKLSQIIYRDECVKHPNLLINVESELCWIDKAPYAKLCNGTPFDKKVELGDAMFIFDEKIVDAHSKSILNERKPLFYKQKLPRKRHTFAMFLLRNMINLKKTAPIRNLSFTNNG